MNDTHAYFDLHPELFWTARGAEYRPAGGYGRLAALANQVRQERPGRVLFFDGGDTIHGTHSAVQTRGQSLVPILQALDINGMTAHWEFAYGPQRLYEIVEQLPYRLLAANCYDKASGKQPFPATTVHEAAGLRVGVAGIAATIVDKTMPAHFGEGLRFTMGNDELPGQIARLRREERADLIVVLSHLGFAQDLKLAEEVDGIDVLLSAHTHNRVRRPAKVGNTLVIQSGCHGSFLGRLDLVVDGGRVVDYRHQLLVAGHEIEPNPRVQSLVDEALLPHGDELREVVGHTATGLNRNTVLEATMDNLLLQALLEAAGAEVAFSNGWRYGAPVPPGPITLNDLWNIIPVNPPVSVCSMTGEEIWAMLEEDLEHTFARDPYRQMGGYFKRCLGMVLYVKLENPSGQRIQELFVAGKPVQPERSYRTAFVTEQGVPEKYGTGRQNLDLDAIAALRHYLRAHDPVDASLRGTVVPI
jgi:S-sulfosulfanyl-L-cysteine sulfohydrolase